MTGYGICETERVILFHVSTLIIRIAKTTVFERKGAAPSPRSLFTYKHFAKLYLETDFAKH
jgi:hypothetical protein